MKKRLLPLVLCSQKYTPFLLVAWVTMMTVSIHAAPDPHSTRFSHKNWDVVCDNTLTCRAAGYSADDSEPAVTVLLTRAAGVETSVSNRVMFAEYDDQTREPHDQTEAPILLINDRSMGQLLTADDDAWQMNSAQFNAFLLALRNDNPIRFEQNDQTYLLSSAGSSAVLLKMDEIQGRIETPTALIKKGNNSESQVTPPVAMPVIIQAAVQDKESREMNATEKSLFKPLISKSLNTQTDCDEELINGSWQMARLDRQYTLIIVPCWYAAYNSGNVYFVVNQDKSSRVMVTESGNYYADGTVGFWMKGRGLGDCISLEEWVWNGESYVHSTVKDTGRCRLIRAGGSWDLPTLVTKVVSP
ncbi:MAG: hypothetical protein XXXJIFNMEKO3_00699 [Candidatus Erwinia impunctatus]|nr:hypothetical protein XXXJIFNMEKO_00699 [Culicoides impunctatus]